MSLFTRAFRSFRAGTFVVGWPAHGKMAPTSGLIISQTSASNKEDRTTNTLPHQAVEENDTDVFSKWCAERLNDPKHTDEDQLGKYRAFRV